MRLIFVHGREQHNSGAKTLKLEWHRALSKGLDRASIKIPADVDVRLAFYGDVLHECIADIRNNVQINATSKGIRPSDEKTSFYMHLVTEFIRNSELDSQFIRQVTQGLPNEKGPLQWAWVLEALRFLETHTSIGADALRILVEDVFIYLTNPIVASKVETIVANEIDEEPCVIVAHSLGSIVAYKTLLQLERKADVRSFITIGSPLGINTIRELLPTPLRIPSSVAVWRNAYDKRDVVALMPISWDVEPKIENYSDANNDSANAHGIESYLETKQIGGWIAEGLESCRVDRSQQ